MIGIASCSGPHVATVPDYVTKKTTFDETIHSVQSKMDSLGFGCIGYENTMPAFSKTNHSESKAKNRPTRQDNYHFVDDFGNTVSFSVSYNKSKNKKGVIINNVELCGCEPSNLSDFEKFCGVEGIINQTLKNPNYSEAIHSVQSFMGNQGFKTISYESVWTKHFVDLRQSAYHFADSLGNIMSYSVYYAMDKYKKGDYVYYSELCGCETSNPDDFERFCGDDGVLGQIKELPKDQDITRKNRAEMATGISFLTVLGGLLLSALFLPLLL